MNGVTYRTYPTDINEDSWPAHAARQKRIELQAMKDEGLILDFVVHEPGPTDIDLRIEIKALPPVDRIDGAFLRQQLDRASEGLNDADRAELELWMTDMIGKPDGRSP